LIISPYLSSTKKSLNILKEKKEKLSIKRARFQIEIIKRPSKLMGVQLIFRKQPKSLKTY